MDYPFIDKKERQALIEHYQDEIRVLLEQRPDLIALQKEIEARLNKVGGLDSVEGRANRAAMAFSLMRESFSKLSSALANYQSDFADLLTQKRKPELRLISSRNDDSPV